MLWLFRAAKHLKELGILGMNRRNAACILDHNPRALFPLVDDKLRMHHLCRRIGVPTPEIYAVIDSHSELRRLTQTIGERGDFVVKPNHGSAGRGVLVVLGRDGSAFVRHNGERMPFDQMRQHLSDILSGMYSLGGQPDQAIVAAACPAASDLRGDHLQGHSGCPRDPLSQRAGDGDAAPADEGIRTAGPICTRAASAPASIWTAASRITPSSATAS